MKATIQKIFTHGTNINFHTCAREMTMPDLKALIDSFAGSLCGVLDYPSSKIFQYGKLLDIAFDDIITIHYNHSEGNGSVTYSTDQLTITHDACFDVFTENEEKKQVSVIYLTFQEKNNELVYFFIKNTVPSPLNYVIDFWEKVKDVGKNVDFSKVSCKIIQNK